MRHGVQVHAAMYVLDLVLPPEVTGGAPVAILLHTDADMLQGAAKPSSDLVGGMQVKIRLVQSQGWVVISVLEHEWAALDLSWTCPRHFPDMSRR